MAIFNNGGTVQEARASFFLFSYVGSIDLYTYLVSLVLCY